MSVSHLNGQGKVGAFHARPPRPKGSKNRLKSRQPPFIGNDLEGDDESDDVKDNGHMNGTGKKKKKKTREEPFKRPSGKNGVVDLETSSKNGSWLRDEFVGSMYQPDSRSRNQEGIFTLRWSIVITRARIEMLVLNQLAYWFGVAKNNGMVRAKIRRDGYYWVYQTYAKLARELAHNISIGQVRAAIRRLKALGVVVTTKDAKSGNILYRLDPIKIQELLEKEGVRPAVADVENDDGEE